MELPPKRQQVFIIFQKIKFIEKIVKFSNHYDSAATQTLDTRDIS
jgi:hypothetical protein